MRTHYETLGVSEDASEEDIKVSYKRRAHECHPDRNGGSKGAEEAFKNLGAAYDVLRDPAKRATYDLELKLRRAAEVAQARRPPPAPPSGRAAAPPRPAPAPTPRWAPPPSAAPSYAATPVKGSGSDFGALLFLMFLGGAAGAAMASAESRRRRWDPNAGRYRDRYGRFGRG